MTKQTNLMTTFMAMGFMISPLSLVILGNGAGLLGRRLLWTLPFIVMISAWTALLYARFLHPAVSVEPKIVLKTDLPWIFSALQLASLVPFCIGASTLILAMAGYALNEIFLYWVPNLLFSICFLVFIVGVNLISPMVSGSFQGISVVIFLGSMLLLLVLGFLNWEKPVFENQIISRIADVDWRALLLLFWLFMAAELSMYNDTLYQGRQAHILSLMTAFAATFAVFWLWGQISLHFAPPERLAETTVPHSIAARAIAGESGRKIMGLVILTGSFASVNALLVGVTAVVASMAKSRQVFPSVNRKGFGGNAAMVFLSVGILCMLLTGMAGKDITETATRSAFCLWLISHAAFYVYAFWQRHQSGGKKKKRFMLPGILTAMVYVAGSVVLIATDPDLSTAIASIIGFILLSMFTIILMRRHFTKKERKMI